MPEPVEVAFVKELMEHIMKQRKIPKVQVERAIGPILGMFIAEALPAELFGHLEIICAEFPLLKEDETMQSKNIDCLLYSTTNDELVFVELKTTDRIDKERADNFLAVIKRITDGGSAAFLFEGVEAVWKVSRKRGKYAEVLNCIKLPDGRYDGLYSNCKKAKLVYLVPKWRAETWRRTLNDQVILLSFEELSEKMSRFAPEWSIIRKCLGQLDSRAL